MGVPAGSVIVLVISRLLGLYSFIIFLRVIMSWLIANPYNRLYRFLIEITEPVLSPIRRILPKIGIDFSPWVALILIQLVNSALLIIFY